jgi:signal transduction histidine kinase
MAGLTSGQRLRRRSVRLRLTGLYGGLFLVSGAMLLAITYVLVRHATGSPVVIATKSSGPVQTAVAGAPTTGPLPELGDLPVPAEPDDRAQHAADRAHDDALHQLLLQSGVALGIMTVSSLALGWVVAGRVLAPLRTITATTRRISQHNLHQRLALPAPDDELKDLGDSIDELLARLENAFVAQRRFVANASHELRTPLTMMRTSLDVAAAKPGGMPAELHALDAKLREGLDRADRLVESFLALARAEHALVFDQTLVRLDTLVAAIVVEHRTAIDTKAIEVTLRLGDAHVSGNEGLFRYIVENLVDNAIRHNDVGGWICLATTQADVDNVVRLSVENGGPVLEQDRVDDLVVPFQRLTDNRTDSTTGVGLGLAIVATLVDVYGGTLQLEARVADGDGGLRVLVELPAAATTTRGRVLE